jgi:hypothetical protein
MLPSVMHRLGMFHRNRIEKKVWGNGGHFPAAICVLDDEEPIDATVFPREFPALLRGYVARTNSFHSLKFGTTKTSSSLPASMNRNSGDFERQVTTTRGVLRVENADMKRPINLAQVSFLFICNVPIFNGKRRTIVLERLSSQIGRNDEEPNIELAIFLCETADMAGIEEIVTGLKNKTTAIVNDCIKVLYEIGQRKPEWIAPHADAFIDALSSKNNRLVWGGMTALAQVAPLTPTRLYSRWSEIMAAYENGSVITIDNSISVFAQLCKTDNAYSEKIFPILLRHLANCRAKEIPQHAERIAICIDDNNRDTFIAALDARLEEMTPTQCLRIAKLKKKL